MAKQHPDWKSMRLIEVQSELKGGCLPRDTPRDFTRQNIAKFVGRFCVLVLDSQSTFPSRALHYLGIYVAYVVKKRLSGYWVALCDKRNTFGICSKSSLKDLFRYFVLLESSPRGCSDDSENLLTSLVWVLPLYLLFFGGAISNELLHGVRRWLQ